MRNTILPLIYILLSFSGCGRMTGELAKPSSLIKLSQLVLPYSVYDTDSIRTYLQTTLLYQPGDSTVSDSVLFDYYKKDSVSFLWIGRLNTSCIDSTLNWLENAGQHGISPACFSCDSLKNAITDFRSLNIQENYNHYLAKVEYNFSRNILKYISGLKYGFIHPRQTIHVENMMGETESRLVRKEWNKLPIKAPDSLYLSRCLDSLKADPNTCLETIQPASPYYKAMQAELIKYQKLDSVPVPLISLNENEALQIGDKHASLSAIAERLHLSGEFQKYSSDSTYDRLTTELLDAVNLFRKRNCLPVDTLIGPFTVKYLNQPFTYYSNKLKVNLERSRWKYELDKGRKYSIVNVAAFMLQAIDLDRDTIIEMRVCCGTVKNKTPLLSSTISHVELNPYWNVPKSIVRKEIIPAYRRDTTYFTRNRMKIYEKRSGAILNPHEINWSNIHLPDILVKQDNRKGNSLGRIVFRFANPFAVYLHDTPSRRSFLRTNRAVSHGCIRLQRPLDFAIFLQDKPDALFEDRIRIAMDIPAKTKKGKRLLENEGYRELEKYDLKKTIPLYLDYHTVYFNPANELLYCNDPYQYDRYLIQALSELNKNK